MMITQVSDVERELRAEIARLNLALAEQAAPAPEDWGPGPHEYHSLPARQDGLQMVDDEGENRAVRMFLALYGGRYGITAEQMRKHLAMAGFNGAWPQWASNHNGHLTKAGAQLWIRHLFSLEQSAEQSAHSIKGGA